MSFDRWSIAFRRPSSTASYSRRLLNNLFPTLFPFFISVATERENWERGEVTYEEGRMEKGSVKTDPRFAIRLIRGKDLFMGSYDLRLCCVPNWWLIERRCFSDNQTPSKIDDNLKYGFHRGYCNAVSVIIMQCNDLFILFYDNIVKGYPPIWRILYVCKPIIRTYR